MDNGIYHNEHLLLKWGMQELNDHDNNNGAKASSSTSVSPPATDTSDNMKTKLSPEFQQRITPETSGQFPHPATPQSYHSAPSPYQNADQNNFSPGTHYGNNFPHSGFSNPHSDQNNWDPTTYSHDYKSTRFMPYNVQDRVLTQVSSASPIYGHSLNQPTPSPSPNQCDKCGFICDSVVQLNEHCNAAHAASSGVTNTSAMGYQQFTNKQYNTGTYQKVKEEHEESSDILDLDSHKVVYQGSDAEPQNSTYAETAAQLRDHSRGAPIMPWETKLYSNTQGNGDMSLFKDQKIFAEQKPISKMYPADQKFAYSQDKFSSVHDDQKPFLHVDPKMYTGVQMPLLNEYASSSTRLTAEVKPSYRSNASPYVPQVTSTQPPAPPLPSMGSKANWKSNEARRPKTYNCTACNKWFTSSGHLKRHYNTTLHKNAVRSSGQPDPATMPISTYHHPSRDAIQNHAQQQNTDTNNTRSPVLGDESRGRDDASLQAPYGSHGQRVGNFQAKSQYTHLPQGNLDNNFSNNPLANHTLQHQVGSHQINVGSQPPGLNPSDSNHHGSKNISISSNPPNGEAGPSVTPNHHMRDLLSVPNNNIIAPVLTQNTSVLTAHPLPSFSHLGVNLYNPMSTDPLGTSVSGPTTQVFINQDFQQNLTPSYPNGNAPHVTATLTSNQLTTSQAIGTVNGETAVQLVAIVKPQPSPQQVGIRLPSFSQFYLQRYGNQGVLKSNVGGRFIADDSIGGFVFSNCTQNNVDEQQNFVQEFNIITKSEQENEISYSENNVNDYNGKAIKDLKIEKFEDGNNYDNKENCGGQMISPNRPDSTNTEEQRVQSNNILVSVAPLTERNLSNPTSDVIHQCKTCNKLFNKACYLTQHNKTFHSGVKPFKCDRCGKRFPDNITYECHYMKHAHDKPFKCSECPKSFNHKTDLRRHMCLHSGSKPYRCEHCGKGFIRQDHMMKHFDTHRKKILRMSMSQPATSTVTSTVTSTTM